MFNVFSLLFLQTKKAGNLKIFPISKLPARMPYSILFSLENFVCIYKFSEDFLCSTPNFTGLNPDSALFNSSVFPAYPLHIFSSFPALVRVEPSTTSASPSVVALQRLIYAKQVFNRREIEKHFKFYSEVPFLREWSIRDSNS